ncbi:MAG: hypothetical protein PVH60_00800 [Anaerolineales bacterium]|jgi:poly(A) polymerase
MQSTFHLPEALIEHLPGPDQSSKVWIVGGALRDHLLGRSYEDVDFAVKGDAIELARTLADAWSWDFFILDDERGAARVLSKDPRLSIYRMDFSRLRDDNIEADLQDRDFTINALAIDVHAPSALIDPTGGVQDLRQRKLRACGPDTLHQDPVRVIRAVRFATEFELTIDRDTIDQIKQAVGGIQDVSIERTRDELFRIFNGQHVGEAVTLLDHLGILDAVFPDIHRFKLSSNGGNGEQSTWQLKLAQIRTLSDLIHILEPEHDAEAAADAIWGSVSLRLGRFRKPVSDHLKVCLADERSNRSLIYYLVLRSLRDPGGGFEFERLEPGSRRSSQYLAVDHDLVERAQAFRLSRHECDYLQNASDAYRFLESALEADEWTDLGIHRYFQTFGEGGLGAVLLFLSHAAARMAGPPDAEVWERRLSIARGLWEAYFERHQEIIAPDPVVDGLDLIQELGLDSGPQIGVLLRAITEAQVTRRVQSRKDALELASELISSADN